MYAFFSNSTSVFTTKECKKDFSNDIDFDLSDQYACSLFKTAKCS